MAKITNQLHKDEIEVDKARALGYLASIICSILKDSDLEERIKKLEEASNVP